jgi:hypothetical protein
MQLDCDIIGNTTKGDGFQAFYGEGEGPERIEIQQIQGVLFFIVEDNGLIDTDIISMNTSNKDTRQGTQHLPDPLTPSPTEKPSPTPNPCGHYGPWADKGPNGPYKCKGGN